MYFYLQYEQVILWLLTQHRLKYGVKNCSIKTRFTCLDFFFYPLNIKSKPIFPLCQLSFKRVIWFFFELLCPSSSLNLWYQTVFKRTFFNILLWLILNVPWFIYIGIELLKKIICFYFPWINFIINRFVDSLPLILVIFISCHRDNSMLIFHINCTLFRNNRCRNSTIFVNTTCIFTFIFSLIFSIVSFILLFPFC